MPDSTAKSPQPPTAQRPVVLIAEELSPATIQALGDGFEIRHCNGADRGELLAALPEAEVPAELARANEAFAERVRVETDALLGKVLYTTSCAMKNSFAMNDNVR